MWADNAKYITDKTYFFNSYFPQTKRRYVRALCSRGVKQIVQVRQMVLKFKAGYTSF